MTFRAHSSHSQAELIREFRSACLKYVNFIQKEKVNNILPFQSVALPIFSALPESVQEKALESILADISIFESMIAENQSIRDTPKHLWRFLSQLELTPESDIFDKIKNTDVVEVYLVDQSGQRQMFRNLRFLECVSYTIEQLYGLDWRIGTEREKRHEGAIFQAALSIMSGKSQSTMSLAIPTHKVQEIGSPLLYTLMITMKYLSPIRRSGQVQGAIVINHTDVVGRLETCL